MEFGIWAIVTAGCYAGYWVMNDNFLTYYVIETINHRITPGTDYQVELAAENATV